MLIENIFDFINSLSLLPQLISVIVLLILCCLFIYAFFRYIILGIINEMFDLCEHISGYFRLKKYWVKIKYRDFILYHKLNPDSWEVMDRYDYKFSCQSIFLYHRDSDTYINVGFLFYLYLYLFYYKLGIIKDKINKICLKFQKKREEKAKILSNRKKQEIKFLSSLSKQVENKYNILVSEQKESDKIIQQEIRKINVLVDNKH